MDNLQWLLQNKDIYTEVLIHGHAEKTHLIHVLIQVFKERNHGHNKYLYDYCDGDLYKNHPLFSSCKDALQLIIYFDEVETVNPLGSYRSYHKLGAFMHAVNDIMTMYYLKQVASIIFSAI